ncbi:MAG: hypothetical protein VW405_20785, partial [Rhodospirillaceae bacterium]
MPDAINPVSWYNSTFDLFSGDEEQKPADANQQPENAMAAERNTPPPGADAAFPKIANVNQQQDYYEARRRGGLVADTQGRQYAPAIARQGEPSSALAAAPPPEP